jgi:hypothetical protein
LLFPAAIADGGEDDLLVIRENEPRRYIASLCAFVAHQEIGQDPAGVRRPKLFLQDQVAIGGMDDTVVDLLEGLGLQQQRFGLGTPDLAAASKLVADEHQHRLALGARDAGQGRCQGRRGSDQAAHHQGPSVDHAMNSSWRGLQYEGAPADLKAGLTAL